MGLYHMGYHVSFPVCFITTIYNIISIPKITQIMRDEQGPNSQASQITTTRE
jgi:hypothetical protein